MVNFSPLAAESGWRVWGTPANFNGFRVLASLLHRHRSTERDQPNFAQCLTVSWADKLLHFWELLPLTEFCQVQNDFASKSCVLLYWQHYCTALEHWASAKLCGVQQRAPPICGSAAIRLGISPHSSNGNNYKDVLPNINCTQAAETTEKCCFCLCDLDLQTRPSEGPNTSSMWVWHKFVQRFQRYFIHNKSPDLWHRKQKLPQFTACGNNTVFV